jgi:hypothetical protein
VKSRAWWKIGGGKRIRANEGGEGGKKFNMRQLREQRNDKKMGGKKMNAKKRPRLRLRQGFKRRTELREGNAVRPGFERGC